MFIVFDFIFIIFAVIYIPYLTIKGKWHKGFWLRMGFIPKALEEEMLRNKNIWVHAVSVGEVLAVLDLVSEIKKIYPGHRIICSTVTKTGNDLAKEKLSENDIVIFAPLDLSFIARKFVRIINPSLYIAAETEIWPNLYSALKKAGKKVMQVNGRISDSAFKGYKNFGFLLKGIIGRVDAFCMQSKIDADRIIEIGADSTHVKVVGNIKFDISIINEKIDAEKYGFNKNAIIFVGGSTHPGEEELLLGVYKKLSKKFPELRLILAPRHVERANEVVSVIERDGYKALRFSQMSDDKVDNNTILLIDTIGHLRSFYGISRIAFIGKSFCGVGGQNVIEPAYFGNTVIVGPHTENFKDAVSMFLKEKAILQLNDPDELLNTLERLLNDPDEIKMTGSLAKDVVFKSQGATERTLEIVKSML